VCPKSEVEASPPRRDALDRALEGHVAARDDLAGIAG